MIQLPLARALVAEAIGTFALVFAGCGAVMVDAKTHALGHFPNPQARVEVEKLRRLCRRLSSACSSP